MKAPVIIGHDAEARFWAKVDKVPSGCWEWTGYVTPEPDGGYGQFGISSGNMVRAHRVAWIIERGPLGKGQCVCHRCDNRRCVNPDHLFIGTQADNTKDRCVKGRSAAGSRHGKTKLHEDDVVMIRSMRRAGATRRELADAFGVGWSCIKGIETGRTWKVR